MTTKRTLKVHSGGHWIDVGQIEDPPEFIPLPPPLQWFPPFILGFTIGGLVAVGICAVVLTLTGYQ